MPLKAYKDKRNFPATSEPEGGERKQSETGKIFVVQEHHASHHHFDLRLERDGVLVSWAVPKGIPGKPGDRKLAVQTEDHPLEYADFEGTIPEGEYGAGEVTIWDKGLYEPMVWEDGKIEVVIKGEKVAGRYILVRFRKAGDHDWLIFKGKE